MKVFVLSLTDAGLAQMVEFRSSKPVASVRVRQPALFFHIEGGRIRRGWAMAQLMESGSSDVSEYGGANPVGMPPFLLEATRAAHREHERVLRHVFAVIEPAAPVLH